MSISRPNNVDRHISRRIRDRRIEVGLTQHRLAEFIGVTGQMIHKIEAGKNRVAAGRLPGFALALGVPIPYFFEGLE